MRLCHFRGRRNPQVARSLDIPALLGPLLWRNKRGFRMIWTILQVAAGGALGATGRYLSGVGVSRLFGVGFPLGTLAVNIAGSFIMGIAFYILMEREAEASPWVPIVMTGILGGFTTFSAFSLDAYTLFDRGRLGAATVYVGGSIGLSFAALVLGIALAKGWTA